MFSRVCRDSTNSLSMGQNESPGRRRYVGITNTGLIVYTCLSSTSPEPTQYLSRIIVQTLFLDMTHSPRIGNDVSQHHSEHYLLLVAWHMPPPFP